MKTQRILMAMSLTALLGACQASASKDHVEPIFTAPVTNNSTPYTRCLASLQKIPGNNLPVFAVGEVSDKTGQIDRETYSHVLSQGVSEMVMSALYKTGKTRLVERFDLRVPLAEMKMSEQKLTNRPLNTATRPIRASDFVLLGALTELNYNIVSGGAGLWVAGIGAGVRTVIINVGLDLRVVNSQTFEVGYVSTLQKQIYGIEVEANVFRFFGTQLVEFDAGRIQNEPLQLGVRSVVEMAVYQIMTDFLGLPRDEMCSLEVTDQMDRYLENRKAKES